MSLVVNIAIVLFPFLLSAEDSNVQSQDETKILIIGQSISANCNQYKFSTVPNVFDIDKNAIVIPAQDPLSWADCTQGAIWIPFGDLLIKKKVSKKVTFMSIGVEAAKVGEWLNRDSKENRKLDSALTLINRKGLKFDYVFYHQGSSDAGLPKNIYKRRLEALITHVRGSRIYAPWMIAQHSKCGETFDKGIEEAQFEFANQGFRKSYFLGPNTNVLSNEYKYDGCHLNKRGQEKAAELWFDAFERALVFNKKAREEAMISIFSRN